MSSEAWAVLVSVYLNAAMIFVALWKIPRAFRKDAFRFAGRWTVPVELRLLGTPMAAQFLAALLPLRKQPYLYAALTAVTLALFLTQLVQCRRNRS